jgi:hypothetical protein
MVNMAFIAIAASAAKPRTDIAVSFLVGVYLPMQYAVRLSRANTVVQGVSRVLGISLGDS